MTIVNKVSFTNVGGGVDLLDKIRTTAVSWGWTQFEWRDGFVFSAASNSWVADVDGGYLALTSGGHGGSQNLIAKLELRPLHLSTTYALAMSMCSSTAYSLTSPDLPVFQNSLVQTANVGLEDINYNGWSLPTGNIPEIWILGNSQYIFVVANCDGVFHTMMEFGSYEMREAVPTAQNGSIISAVTLGNDPWYEYAYETPAGVSGVSNVPSVGLTNLSRLPYWEDQVIPYASCYITVRLDSSGLSGMTYYNTFTEYYENLLTTGDNSGRRLMMRNTVLYKRPSDGLVVPVSETYASLFNGFGLQPGQSLSYGTDEYIVFPCCSILSSAWLAFRIA
jgi:hypothetical protein